MKNITKQLRSKISKQSYPRIHDEVDHQVWWHGVGHRIQVQVDFQVRNQVKHQIRRDNK